jgi:hypothetical protein
MRPTVTAAWYTASAQLACLQMVLDNHVWDRSSRSAEAQQVLWLQKSAPISASLSTFVGSTARSRSHRLLKYRQLFGGTLDLDGRTTCRLSQHKHDPPFSAPACTADSTILGHSAVRSTLLRHLSSSSCCTQP